MAQRVTTARRERTRRADEPREALLAPLLRREIAAIAAIDAAIAAEKCSDYVVLYQGTKTGKQSNIEQMSTLIRMRGGIPKEDGGFRKYLLKGQSAITERVAGTAATLQAMQRVETRILRGYIETIEQVEGLTRQSLLKALGRTLVHWHLLTAHIAKRTGSVGVAKDLPQSLDQYFAGPTAKACMRCHLDRPGILLALERVDPHPYTYICSACHGEVLGEFPPDLASQIHRWPERTQQTRVLQHAVGRPSVLNAMHTVLFPLSGLAADPPRRVTEKVVTASALPPTPKGDNPAILNVEPQTPGEAAYVAQLFDYRSVRTYW